MTVDEWLGRLGEQVRAVRIALFWSQADLAEQANVSLRSVQTLEAGGGSSLKTLIAVARALDRTDWLNEFDPRGETLSPVELLRERRRQSKRPQRVRKPRD
jgi:transcriptional regulator with XRE-family HTH domain